MARWTVWACLALAACAPLRAQESASGELEAGNILVADVSLKEAAFAQTVILLIHYDVDGTVGIILNRPTRTPLSEVFPGQAKQKNGKDPVYEGGPVDQSGVIGLLRSSTEVSDSGHVFADVYATTSKDVLGDAVSSQKPPRQFRAYLGYAGWAQGQLEFEIEAGAWRVLDGDPKLVFDGDPGTLWRRLFDHANLRMAQSGASDPAASFIPADFPGLEAQIEKHAPAVRPMR